MQTLHRLLLIELAVTGAALLLAGLIGWWLVHLGLRPLRAIERSAGEIAAGDLSHRVPGENPNTEVGRLATALNVMLQRIQEAFAARQASEMRLRRFVADASHELRTPVAAVSAYAELFERGASNRPEDLARVMTGIRGETARMGSLVEDLLLLARLDESRPIDRAPVDLVAVAADARSGVAPGVRRRRSGDRPGRPDPYPPGVRQPSRQRARPHAARHHRNHHHRVPGRRGRLPGQRQRTRHHRRERLPPLRALFPG
jgi:two-component system OmpR family sensor kinase